MSKNNYNFPPSAEVSIVVRGADRDRTGDLLVANQALSQLSYSPKQFPIPIFNFEDVTGNREPGMSIVSGASVHTPFVGLSGVEPLTSRLSGVRSNHLSYRPSVDLVKNVKEQNK